MSPNQRSITQSNMDIPWKTEQDCLDSDLFELVRAEQNWYLWLFQLNCQLIFIEHECYRYTELGRLLSILTIIRQSYCIVFVLHYYFCWPSPLCFSTSQLSPPHSLFTHHQAKWQDDKSKTRCGKSGGANSKAVVSKVRRSHRYPHLWPFIECYLWSCLRVLCR